MEQVWVWEYDTGDGEKHDLFMDPGILGDEALLVNKQRSSVIMFEKL